jgi:spore coat protein CotH
MRRSSHTRRTLQVLAAAVLLGSTGLSVAGCASEAAADTTVTTDRNASSAGVHDAGDGLFDASVIHQISVFFSQHDYDAMIETYKNSDTKDWIKATVTIDGAAYQDVGIRLKGNSSLRGLGNGRGGGPGGDISADEPEGLPWLVRLDKFVDGQSHGGVKEFVVRSNTSETALNEAVATELLALAGLASQKAIAASFSVNESEAVLRLVIEHPDDVWMAANFSIQGALYKAESTGDYSYRGADPESYDEVFDQEAGKKNADLTPLIEFLDFLNNSDDATFYSTLAERLDVESFATYLAMQELIANSDDIDGPGNNSYLYYDPADGRFTVVAWDHNLAFGGMSAMGPGAMGPGANTNTPDWGGSPPDAEGNPPDAGEFFPKAGDRNRDDWNLDDTDRGGRSRGGRDTGSAPPGDMVPGDMPPGGMTPEEMASGDARTDPWKAGFGGKSNKLVERFRADSELQALYEERLATLKAQLFDSGVAADVLARWVTLLETQASDLVDAATVQSEAAKISSYLTGDRTTDGKP